MHIVDHGNNARISRRRQMYSLSGGVVPPAYLSHLLFQAGGTDWSSFNQQVGPPSFVGGFAALDGVDDYLGADFIQDYDGCSIWAVVEVTATNPADFADGIHPNDSGHAKLAAYITRSIGANYGILR
jgi:lysophospholipase L1-like esterase